MLKVWLCVCAITAVLWTGSAWSGEETKPFVGERHKQRGLTCVACHREPEPKTAAPAEACLPCHQSMEAVAGKTANRKPNPHQNHVTEAMDLECTLCHHSHKADAPMCHQCHLGMEFEKKTEEAK